MGVMSGTSLDGIDLAHIHFFITEGQWSFTLQECETISYSLEWQNKLRNAVHFSSDELTQLNLTYTPLLGSIISKFIKKHQIQQLDAVCSHGHTVLHQPQNGVTLQIGNLPEIAKICNQTVVCDFRVQDVAMGGQGAPLVPIGDRILFNNYEYCLNLGGFSNVSFEHQGNRIAFDISPVNTVLNFLAEQLGNSYDEGGKWAASGTINTELLQILNNISFYQQKFPKSLGIEFVKNIIIPILDNFEISLENKLCTFVEHIAIQISQALPTTEGNMLVTGGGAYNLFLLERMKHYMPLLKLTIPEAKILEFKEALIFGLLGILKLRNEINVLASVTGAPRNHSSGIIFAT